MTLAEQRGLEEEEINISAYSTKSEDFLFATKKSSSPIGGLSDGGSWEQVLQRNSRRYHRLGVKSTGPGVSMSDEAVDTKREDSTIPYLWPRFEPYFLPVSGHPDRYFGDVDKRYVSFLLRHIDLDDAEWMKDGSLLSRWTLYKQRMEIIFHPKVNFLPVRILRFLPVKTQSGAQARQMIMDQEILWEEFPGHADGDVLVPTRFHGISFNGSESTEIDAYLVWRDPTDGQVPEAADTDWLESIRSQFDEDWELTFDEWREIHARKSARVQTR
ncbi:hypothetical protein [Stieleria neptunia]|nr:hypothetical protein [Stieleria neptunia]